ncbi:MAG: outer membrane beta-barrel protein [bacterium]
MMPDANLKQKRIVMLVCILVIIFSYQLNAAGLYVGGGGTYAIEGFNTDSDYLEYDNTFGAYGKFGLKLDDRIALEFNYDSLTDFVYSLDILKSTIDLTTYMAALKLSFKIDSDSDFFSGAAADIFGNKIPYFIIGFGNMKMHKEINFTYDGNILTGWDLAIPAEDLSDSCGKAGFGVDYYIQENISVGAEISYTAGFGDLKDIKYYNIIMGGLFHF